MKEEARKYRSPDGLPVDIAIFTITSHPKSSNYKMLAERRLQVLLVRRSRQSAAYPGYWALPGGFSNEDETLLEAAHRELQEETNVERDVMIEQLQTYYYPGRDPRGWIPSVAFYALVKEDYLLRLAADADAEDAQLFEVNDALKMKLAFDHNVILLDALARIRIKMMTTTIAREFLPDEFTLRELYQVIQTVVPSFEEDLANFKRNLLAAKTRNGLIREVLDANGNPKVTDRNSNRPAQLYTFTDYEPMICIYNSGMF